MNLQDFIGEPFKLEDFEVSHFDYHEKLNFEGAKNLCLQIGNNWRLPSKKELNIIFKNKKQLNCEIYNGYWCSIDDNDGFAWYKYFGSGNWTNCKNDCLMSIRLVRTV